MYADYIRENTFGDVIETDQGFASFVFPDAESCYIKDIYVKPEYRMTHKASDISAIIEGLAKERGCKKLLGSVVPSAKNSTRSLKVLLAYGFTLQSSSNDFILFQKDL
jgi:hypothetical protein